MVPVARAESRRHLAGNRPASGVAEVRSAAGVARERRRQRLFIVFDLGRTSLHARRARRHRICGRARSRDRQESLGRPERAALRERSRRWSAQHADRGRRSSLRARRQRRPHLSRERHRQEDLVDQHRPEVRRRESLLGLQRITVDRRRSHPRQHRRAARAASWPSRRRMDRRCGSSTTTAPATRRRC